MAEKTALDPIHLESGLAEAEKVGIKPGTNGMMLVGYCLGRWAKGEEKLAERTAVGMGIDLTTWRRILAAARAHA